jgi:predicted component of type VI protein secretion system
MDSTKEELATIAGYRTEQLRQVMAAKQKLIELLHSLHLNEEDRRKVEAVLNA